MADQHLAIWLQENRGYFHKPTSGQCWQAVYAAYSGNGGRPNSAFESAVNRLGYAVRPSVNAGFTFGKVKSK